MSKIIDTIVASSTPSGEGGIGIIRLSGPKSESIAKDIFDPQKDGVISAIKSHTIRYGYIKDPNSKEIIDEVLITFMKGPKTYTAEDIVEINCHGGPAVLKKVMEICIKAGARLAEPGEFTKRAFLNGRISLQQAEAVQDLIGSSSELSRKMAVNNLKGSFTVKVRELREKCIEILSRLELEIDFSDEDVEAETRDSLKKRINDIETNLDNLLKTADNGIILKNGIRVVIAGRPNVGKSSLMNSILDEERVIVTDIAGTTRDVVEEKANILGFMLNLADTAGITHTDDKAEKEGVKRSKEKIDNADLILFVLDVSSEITKEDKELFGIIKDKKHIIILNKTDLEGFISEKEVQEELGVYGEDIARVSALKKEGISGLEKKITDKAFGGDMNYSSDSPIVTSVRHKDIIDKALMDIRRAKETAIDNFNFELLASDINDTLYQLGLITGETVNEEVLDKIFSEFCIGK